MPNYCDNSLSIEGPHDTLRKIHDLVRGEENPFDFEKIIPMPADVEDWYDWRCENWGTKWNSSGALIVDDNTYEFDTAWSTPYEVLVELSKQFPNSTISVDYADEDIGSNCGSYVLKNGELLEETNGDDDFALDLWGYDEEDKKEFFEECRNNN